MHKFRLVYLILFVFFNNSFANTPSDYYTANDVFAFKRIGDVVASPDEKKIAFTVMQVQMTQADKKWQSTIYLKDGNTTKLLTAEHLHASMPVWSPNGKQIAYLVEENKKQSIWLFDLAQNKNRKWFEFNGIAAMKWSPDSKSLAFVGTEKNPTSKSSLTNVDTKNMNSRVFLVSLDSNKISALTPENVSITKNFPSAVDAGFDFSPDSQSIVFSYQMHPEAAFSNQSKLAIAQVTNHKITYIPYRESANQPFYSGDGKWIAFHSHPSDPMKLTNNSVVYGEICVTKASDFTATHCLANTFNENPVMIGWYQENKILVLDAYKTTGIQVYSLDLDPTIPAKQISTQEGFIDPLTISLNQNHTLLGFSYETKHTAPEAFVSPIENFHLTQVSNVQSAQQKNLGEIKNITWKSKDNTSIEGLLITPAHYDSKKKYPLLVMVHGGPAGVWPTRYLGGCEEYGEYFVPGCFANLTSQGFILFQPNPRGSTGYGKAFRTANFKDFGGKDYQDIMSGVDYLVQNNIADPNHLAIFGWSYGGYMTAWAITQTQRFKVAIDGDGLTDLISFSGTTDIPFYLTQYLGDAFWNNDKLYLQRSPIFYVKQIKTPLLILHGENDNRVPRSQSEELYAALKLQNKSVKMLVAPDTEHVPLDANIIYEEIMQIQDWLAVNR